MPDCNTCAHAIWDYERYYGSTAKDWFLDRCGIGLEEGQEHCEGYKEYTEDNE